jgi:hypothetical protein
VVVEGICEYSHETADAALRCWRALVGEVQGPEGPTMTVVPGNITIRPGTYLDFPRYL